MFFLLNRHLLLRDALRVSGQDLVLHLVDGPVDGGDELLPADTKSLHGVLAVPVFEHERLLESAFKTFSFLCH